MENFANRILSEKDLTEKGVFVLFRKGVALPGVSIRTVLRAELKDEEGRAVRLSVFRRKLQEALELLKLEPSFPEREADESLAGTDRVKFELLQMFMLEPKLILLEEQERGEEREELLLGIEAYRRLHPDAQCRLIADEISRNKNTVTDEAEPPAEVNFAGGLSA